VRPFVLGTDGGGEHKKMKRALLTAFVAVVLLAVSSSPIISASPRYDNEGEIINIIVGGDENGLNGAQLKVQESDLESFVGNVQSFKSWIEEARPFMDLELTEEEKTTLETKIQDVIGSLNIMLQDNGREPLDHHWLFREMFENEVGRSTIVSVGMGYCYIPFYEYETFFGIQLRPIWMIYPPLFLGGGGYTGNLNINYLPPRVEYGDRLGGHMARTTFFSGLYVNIGDLGYDKVFGGLMLLMGSARVVM
jgi:hypothetical protein